MNQPTLHPLACATHAVVSGNPLRGLSIAGPFSERDAAIDYAELNFNRTDDYWIADVAAVPPRGYDVWGHPEGWKWESAKHGQSQVFATEQEAVSDAHRHAERGARFTASLDEQKQAIVRQLRGAGEFAAHLADAWLHADSSNRARIEQAFDDLFQRFASEA